MNYISASFINFILVILVFADVKFHMIAQRFQKAILKMHIWGKLVEHV